MNLRFALGMVINVHELLFLNFIRKLDDFKVTLQLTRVFSLNSLKGYMTYYLE